MEAGSLFVFLMLVAATPAQAGVTKSAGSGASNHDIYLGCADTSSASKPNVNTAELRAMHDGRAACSTFRGHGDGCIDDCKNGG